jgi:nucleoside 2-deoxyribosyltransferase
MKAAEIVEALERFFLDVIGQIIPGFCLLIGSLLIWDQLFKAIKSNSILDVLLLSQGKWVASVALSYVVGHGITSVGDTVVVPGVNMIASGLKKIRLGKLVPRSIVPQSELFNRIQNDPVFLAFSDKAKEILPSLTKRSDTAISVPTWRNIAMSMASGERNTVYRFMFISLLNQGIATVLLFVVALKFSVQGFQSVRIDSALQLSPWLFCGLIFLLSLPFLERRYVFYRIAMEVPFSMALIAINQEQIKRAASAALEKPLASLREMQLAIYLAGGFQSGWQDKVREAAPRFRYFDPRFHRLRDKNQYATWDLQAIQRSDWIFAYLENSNPGGYALATEIGYAKALGKRIILVNEKSGNERENARYFDMLSATSDVEVANLSEGIEFLQKLEAVT